MTSEEKFSLQNVEWNYVPSREMGSPPGKMIRTNPKVIVGQCNMCHKNFSAREGRGPGQFINVLGGVAYFCPCGNSSQIDISAFA
jgi:hypothetical protein